MNRRAVPLVALLSLVLILPQCRSLRGRLGIGKTCLVLSVGGAKGMAHIGAVEAAQAAGWRFDCVYGNSMGAVIAALYAADPETPVGVSYRKLIAAYADRTANDKAAKGFFAFITGLVLVVVTGGTLGWETILGSLASATLQALFLADYSNERFELVLREHLRGAKIESLAIPFATSHQKLTGTGLDMVITGSGDVAAAVAASANNPFIWQDSKMGKVDPGSDRMAAVPVEEACSFFRPSRVIVVNVAGTPAVFTRSMDCHVVEITVELNATIEALQGKGPAFDKIHAAGAQGWASRF